MTSVCAAVARLELLACTVTLSTVPVLPVNVSRAVVSGMIAMLSWSWKPLLPFDLNTPITLNDFPPMRTC